MRHLNKIIFLNSANIPYAEVMLDGNVHFAGTQGVGKSTVLRALLFFYNADKMRLGIQQGQRSFEEFYFRHGNSYIIYEVKTEHGAYSIMVSRSNGKVAYRFIDAPYQKEWFVDSDRRVSSDWIQIRERIGNQVDISAKIDTYEFYRNIIFGNTHDRSHRYDKYALVESSKYQNIPRSIQNVFLNSKLDADFVKDTIIQSMSDTEDAISLATYRHLVADFEREFDEIDCWYKKDTNGNVVVRTKATKVIESYRSLIAHEYELKQTWHQLNYSVNHTRKQLPVVEDEIHDLHLKLEKIKAKLDSAQQEYAKEHDLLTGKIGECKTRLSDIRSKRKHYENININAIIDLVSQESRLKSDQEQKENILHTLQEKFKDVTEKYRRLREELDSEWKKFELSQKEELQHFRDELHAEQENSNKQREKRKRVIEDAYDEWLANSEMRMQTLHDEYNHTDKRLSELQYWHPMKQEIDACKEQIQNLRFHDNEYRSKLTIVKSELETLQKEASSKIEQTEHDYYLAQEVAKRELERLKADLVTTKELLARYKGSLYEWLTDNKPGWEENIGKVIDEQHVLYAHGFNPELDDTGNFFGIKLDLEAIPVHHRTPDEYRALQKEQEEAIASKIKELNDLQVKCKNDADAIRKSYRAKLNDKKQEETNIRYQIGLIPQKHKDAETTLRQLEQKEKEKLTAEREKRTAEFNEAQLNLEKEKDSRTQQRAKHDKEIKEVDNNYNSALRNLQKRLDAFKQKQTDLKSSKQADINGQRMVVERQEHDELMGKGADTKAIESCRNEITNIKRILNDINDQRHFVIEFRKDEEELFSHEQEFREDKRQLETKDAQLRQTFENKCKRYESDRTEKSAELQDKKSLLDAMRNGLKQHDQLCHIENIIPEALLQDDEAKENNNSCTDLVCLVRGVINKKRIKNEELKRSVNSFNSHFGANNTFHFIEPRYDEDYMAFARNLQDFIDNNKIEDYRERVSEHYNTILRSISREVGLLMNHSAEIKAIINDVNRDFRERNFAGVIRSIELRAEESSDRMMQLLRSIRDFTEENSLSIGEQNLFSGGDYDQVNVKVVEYLKKFMKQLQKEPSRTELTLSDTFRLQFRIEENDNNTGWVERISNVGSDGTDILVKAMVNIMLINVFKTKAARKQSDFIIHCMMDEIGKLHPSNVAGILQFANVRNIYLINSSPMGYNADIYKYNYLLTKDNRSQTHIKRLMTINR